MPGKREVTGLGDRIREARERWGGYGETGRTQFADATGIPYNTLREYELGKRQPTAWPLMRIATVADVSADYLIFGGEKPKPDNPRALVDAAMRAIVTKPEVRELGRVERALFEDRMQYIGSSLRRSVVELTLYLRRLHARTLKQKFDLEEERREILREDDEDDNGT